VLLTKDEYYAMVDGLADTDGPTTAVTSITDWLTEHGATLGIHYANELDRHFSRAVRRDSSSD
jgi:NADH dehydrogenase